MNLKPIKRTLWNAREKEQSIIKEYQNYIYKGDPLLSSGNTEIFDRDILSLDL